MKRAFHISVAALVVFVLAAIAVVRDATATFDLGILRALRADDGTVIPGPDFVQAYVIDLTGLGSIGVLILTTLLAAGFLAAFRRWLDMAYLLTAAGIGTLAVNVLKPWFGLERPDVVPHLVDAANESFPSGHATMSSVVFLAIAIAATRSGTRARTVSIVTAAIIFVLVSFSRVALGVHTPTDVIAGTALGVAIVAGCDGIWRRFLRKDDDSKGSGDRDR